MVLPEMCPRCARDVPEVCPRCAPGGCARGVPQVCFVPEVCPRCAPGVPEIVPQVCPRCAPGVHRQITELPIVTMFCYLNNYRYQSMIVLL